MTVQLSKLESDLLAEFAGDDQCLFEVFAHVRLHTGDDPRAIRTTGRDLLASWISRGWLEVVPAFEGDDDPDAARDISEILPIVDRAKDPAGEYRGASTFLRLTRRAYDEAPGLSRER